MWDRRGPFRARVGYVASSTVGGLGLIFKRTYFEAFEARKKTCLFNGWNRVLLYYELPKNLLSQSDVPTVYGESLSFGVASFDPRLQTIALLSPFLCSSLRNCVQSRDE